MQTFAILMAIMGVVIALDYLPLSWLVLLIICSLVLLFCVVVVIFWYSLSQRKWKNEPGSE